MIAAAGASARAEDSAVITQTRNRIDKAASHMERLAGTVATIREQRRRLLWAAGGTALATTILMAFLPGTIARVMPESWHWPARMAAHILRLDRWNAGERVLTTSDTERWRAVVLGSDIVQDNQNAIAACLRTAAKAHKPARCTVRITSPE